MTRSPLIFALTAVLLGACSPAAYHVNSPASPQNLPESEREGYMRILGDLRWDQLTSKEEWVKRFPDCLTDLQNDFEFNTDVGNAYTVVKGRRVTSNFPAIISRKTHRSVAYSLGVNYATSSHESKVDYKDRKDFSVGGVSLSPTGADFAENTGTRSGTMTSDVTFVFFDDSRSRAFKSAIAQKYTLTTSGYCSKFTCWYLGNVNEAGGITAKPTPYTVSLLDSVKVDKSDI